MTTSGERADTGLAVASKVVAVGNPAAGADWAFNVISTLTLVGVAALLTTSAVVANRTVQLTIADNGGHRVYSSPFSGNQAASNAERYSWGAGLALSGAGGSNSCPTPSGLVVGAGWTIATFTGALDVGDQWSNIVLTFAG